MGRPKGLPKTGGRQKGSPNKVTTDLREFAGQYTEEAVNILASIARSSESDAARVAAAKELLDRGHGRAPQAMTVSGDAENPLNTKHEVIVQMISTPDAGSAN